MGWATDLHDASFKGVPFECTTISDSMSKTIAIHQAPYSNDASIEDMGNEPRRVSVQAIYAGEDYQGWLSALEAALIESGPGELIHPIFGVNWAQVANHNVSHDVDNYDACSISIDFIIKKNRKQPRFIPVQVQNSIDPTTLIDLPAATLKQALDQLEHQDPNGFFNVINTIRNGLQNVHKFLGIAKSTLENLLSPAAWTVGLVNDITQLVTFDTHISAISKWRDLAKRVQRFDGLFDGNDTPKELKQLWRATQVASQIAITQSIVATVRKEMSDNRDISLTPIDLAVIRQHNRQILQQAIRIEREQPDAVTTVAQIQVYKQVADQLHLQIQELIEVRPPLTSARILVPCSLHWLAHYLYEDMSRSTEILRLNPDLVNPALLQKGMELTVYAR